jgi:thioredoxin-like negative regulator of GroEL
MSTDADAASNHMEFAYRAWRAESAWQWRSAIQLWDQSIDLAPADRRFQGIGQKASCLIEIGHVREAGALFSSITDRVEGLAGLANLATLQDDPQAAGLRWDQCAAEFPESPLGLLGKAQLLFDREAYALADALLGHGLTRWPESPEIAALWARCATAMKRWTESDRRWKYLLVNHPQAQEVRTGFMRHLAIVGDRSEIAILLSRFVDDPVAVAECLVEYHSTRDDFSAAVEQARTLVNLERDKPGHRFRQAQLLLRHGSPEALHATVWVLKDLHERAPDSVWTKVLLSEAYIRSELNDDAHRLIDSIPKEDRRTQVDALRAWATHRQGQELEARRLWSGILERQYIAAVHSPIENLSRVDGNDSIVRPEEVVLISAVRNEAPRLDWFLTYYRKLGVTKFVIVDNASTDDTLRILLNAPDTIVYQTADSYNDSGAGMRWINELLDRHGRKNWCLYVDVDEAFVFPADDRLRLGDLTDYLSRNGDEAVVAPMLDMFPAAVPGSQPLADDTWTSSFIYFDKNVWSQGFHACPYHEQFGGVRRRLFGGFQLMNKVPLINGAAGVRFLLSSHRITPAKISHITAALLHYHLVYLLQPEFRSLFGEAIERREFTSNGLERLRSQEMFGKIAQADSLLDRDSVRFESGTQLAELGIAAAGEDFFKFAEERAQNR